MVRRSDQQLLVNKLMVTSPDLSQLPEKRQRDYLLTQKVIGFS